MAAKGINPKHLEALYNAVNDLVEGAAKDGLSAGERGEAIRDYYENEKASGDLAEFVSWLPELD
jgi:hypothetical protein